MEILIQAKKSAADPRIKAYAQAKLEKLTRHFDHILEARMELSTERNKSLEDVKVAELTVHVTGRTGNILKAVQSAEHMNEAIDLVIDKMIRQIRQHKEKLKDHRHAKAARGIGEAFGHGDGVVLVPRAVEADAGTVERRGEDRGVVAHQAEHLFHAQRLDVVDEHLIGGRAALRVACPVCHYVHQFLPCIAAGRPDQWRP